MTDRPGPRGAPPYLISTPNGIACARGKHQAIAKARDLVGAMPQVTERDLAKFWGTVIARTSEEHAKRHGL